MLKNKRKTLGLSTKGTFSQAAGADEAALEEVQRTVMKMPCSKDAAVSDLLGTDLKHYFLVAELLPFSGNVGRLWQVRMSLEIHGARSVGLC